ncbi:MAG: PAS domain S-box protein [SAR324 cluster bacterium]|nr:PAS domain S-box protein [SAR324 cluster bacterium]
MARAKEQKGKLEVHLRMLEAIFDTIPVAVLAKDLDGNMLIGNQAAADFLGYEKEQIPGRRHEDIGFGPAKWERQMYGEMYEDDQRILETGEKLEKQVLVKFSNGKTDWVHMVKGPFRDYSGNIAGFVAVWRKITDEKFTEDKLRESESLYRALVEGSVQGIMVIARQRYVFANEACARIFGYDSAEEFLQLKKYTDLIAPADQARARSYYRSRMQGKEVPSNYEAQGVKKDGSLIWLNANAKKIIWNGDPAILLTYTDITHKKQSESELTARRLDSISVLTKGIAGEVSDIFGLFQNTIERARMESYACGAESVSEVLSETAEISQQAQNLINQLLILCRAGVPAKEPVVIARLIAESLPFASQRGNVISLKRNNVSIKLSIAANLPEILVDKEQIKQVLKWLISFGEQAMPFGGAISISADCYTMKDGNTGLYLNPGKYVKIAVKDQGAGLVAEVLQRLFDPYFVQDSESGGAGLAGAYSIIKNHGGTITAHSKPGKGTRLTMYLPVQLST